MTIDISKNNAARVALALSKAGVPNVKFHRIRNSYLISKHDNYLLPIEIGEEHVCFFNGLRDKNIIKHYSSLDRLEDDIDSLKSIVDQQTPSKFYKVMLGDEYCSGTRFVADGIIDAYWHPHRYKVFMKKASAEKAIECMDYPGAVVV